MINNCEFSIYHMHSQIQMVFCSEKTVLNAVLKLVDKKRGQIVQGGASYPPDDQKGGCQNSRGVPHTPLISTAVETAPKNMTLQFICFTTRAN